jgi:hypothetical protein
MVNSRVPNFAYEEQTVRIIEYNAPTNPPSGAGPQTVRALQGGEVPRLLEYTEEGPDGRITSQALFAGSLMGSEIFEIVVPTATPFAPIDGRLTSLPAFSGSLTGAEVMELIATGRGASNGDTENATLVPLDGQLTSLQRFLISLAGTEVMEMVTPNNASSGNNYQITTAALAAYFSVFPFVSTSQIPQGATYNMKTTDTRILVIVGTVAVTPIVVPLAASMLAPYPVLIKDLVGNAGADNVQITFSGGELCDGLSEILIDNNYGWVTINPKPAGGGWYQS